VFPADGALARFADGKVDGKQKYKSYYFDGGEYPTEASVRTALQHKVVLTNSAAGRAKMDAKFNDVIEIHRAKHLLARACSNAAILSPIPPAFR